MTETVPLKPTMRQIAADVASAHGLRALDLYRVKRHEKWVCHPRQEAMARMSYAGFSHPRIVKHFGLKNHTTSVYAKQEFEKRPEGYRVPMSDRQCRNMSLSSALAKQEAA